MPSLCERLSIQPDHAALHKLEKQKREGPVTSGDISSFQTVFSMKISMLITFADVEDVAHFRGHVEILV